MLRSYANPFEGERILTGHLLTDLLEKLKQYKVKEDAGTKIFVNIAHIDRLKKFKNDIKSIFDNTFKLLDNMGYLYVNDRAKYYSYEWYNQNYAIPAKHDCNNALLNFPFKISAMDDQQEPDMASILVWRLAIELFYCKKGYEIYSETIIEMSELVTSALFKEEDLLVYHNLLKAHLTAKTDDLTTSPALWDLCYIWDGGKDGFVKHQIADEKQAREEYSTGRIENPIGVGGCFSDLIEGPAPRLVRVDNECELKYFYPLREEVANFDRLLGIFANLRKVLAQDYYNELNRDRVGECCVSLSRRG
jgi:hypothetical protein